MSETREIPSSTIEMLRKDPKRYSSVFDELYGPGAASAALGGDSDPLRVVKDEEEPRRREMTIAGRIWDNTVGAVAYGAQEAVNETVDTFESFNEWYGIRMEEMGIPAFLSFTDADGNFDIQFKHRSEIIAADENFAFFGKGGVADDGVEFNFKEAPQDLPGQLVAGAAQFLTSYGSIGRVIKAPGVAGSFVKGALADATAFDPSDANLSALAEGLGVPDNVVTDLLATNPDDPEIVNRLRNAAEGAIIGGAVEYLVYLAKARSAARAGNGAAAEDALRAAAKEAARIEKEVLEAEAPAILKELEDTAASAREIYAELEPVFKLNQEGKLVVEVPEARVRELDGAQPVRDGDQLELSLGDKPDPTPAPDLGVKYLTPNELESIRYYSKLGQTAAPEELIRRTAISTIRQFERVEDIQPILAAFAEQFKDEWMKTPGRATEAMKVTAGKGTLEAKKLADLVGTNPKAVWEKFKTLDGVTLDNLAGEVTARSYFVNALMEETAALSKAITEGTFDKAKYPGYRDIDQLMVDYQYKMTLARYLADQNDALGSALGRALNARKLQRSGSKALKRIMADPYFVNDAKLMAKAQQEALKSGEKAVLKEVGKVSLVRQTLDRINTYRINALLSGPGTQEVNFLSNLLNSVMLPMQQVVGGVFRRDAAQIEDGFRTLQGMVASAWDSIDAALKAWNMEDAILDQVSQKIEGDFTGKTKITSVEAVDKVIRLPSRFLLGMDEFFKQSSYRGVIFADANRIAKKKGLKGKDRQRFIQGYIKNSFDETGMGIRDEALLQAQRVTFTEPLDPKGFWGGIQRMAVQYPAMRFIVPFVRTPVNLLIASYHHIPLVARYSQRYAEDIKAGGRRAAQARGREAIGLALLTILGATVGQGNITGSGPSDPRLREVWLKNNKPYSVRIEQPDGSVRWVSYQRLEPFANIVAIASDLNELFTDEFNENGGRGSSGVLMSLFATLAENSVNKTFTQGIYDFMKLLSDPNPEVRERSLNQMIASFKPNIINQMNGDEVLREGRTLSEIWGARGSNYERVDPQRNILGEVIYRPSPKWDPLNALYKDVREVDRVIEQITKLGIENQTMLGAPSKTIKDPRAPGGRIDLSRIRYSETQSLYDKWLETVGTVEIRGRTLRQSLEEMMEKPAYLKAPVGFEGSGKGTKLYMVRELVSQYREAARESIPELRDLRQAAERAQRDENRRQFLANTALFPSAESSERALRTGQRTLNDIFR